MPAEYGGLGSISVNGDTPSEGQSVAALGLSGTAK